MERRWGKRLVVNETVRIIGNDGRVRPGFLRNASLSGGLVDTRWRGDELANLKLEIVESGRISAVDACIVRLTATGVGVEWRDLGPECISALLQTKEQLNGRRMQAQRTLPGTAALRRR